MKSNWYKKAQKERTINLKNLGIAEGVRFFDPQRNQSGVFYTYTLEFPPHTTVWRKRYDSGEIEDLYGGDLDTLEINPK
jgi:hypothetical protein